MTDSNDRGGRPPGRPGGRSFDGGDRPPRRRPEGGAPRAFGGPPKRAESRGAGPAEVRPAPEAAPEVAEPAEERIAKVIARAGVASRRDAEAMIAEGRVTLNGEVLTSPAQNVGRADVITVDGEPLPLRERTRLWLFHKPRGLVTTARDPEGRQTVFDALPDDMPRVVAIGRLDINTEGLLLLTNDGGLAKVVAHPETGWTRRYRVRAHGEIEQAALDKLRHGITVDGMDYGPIEAQLDRVQGDNSWISLALREGKNREVKRVLEHLGLRVNRLIRLSFGPFQLGDLEDGLVEEVRTRVLKDQLGKTLAEQAGVDFESPVREPIAPFGKPAAGPAPRQRSEEPRRAPRRDDAQPRPRRAGEDGRAGEDPRAAPRPPRQDGPSRPARAGFVARDRAATQDERPAPARREPRNTVWRSGEGEERPAKRHARREDPRADRTQSAERPRERVAAIPARAGRKILVERIRPARDEAERPRAPRRDERGPPQERPARAGFKAGGANRSGPPRADRPARAERPPRADRPDRAERPSRADGGVGKPRGAFGAKSERGFGGRPGGSFGDKPGGTFRGKPGFGAKPGFGGKPGGRPGGGAGRPGARPGGRDR